ncbi:MAG: PAS domain S-box protein [Thermoplasmata archaeon]|nr:PAS domain S-box protein [Thermoplasmata archaeon]
MDNLDKKKKSFSSKYIIVGIDKDSNITAFNSHGEKLTGFTRSDVLHKKVWDVLIPPDYADSLRNHIQSISTETFEIPLVSKKGKNIPITWKVLPIQGSKDNDLCLIGVERGQEKKLLSSSGERKSLKSFSDVSLPSIKPSEIFKSLKEISEQLARERELLDEQWRKLNRYASNIERFRRILYREKEKIFAEKSRLREKKKRFDREYRERIRKLDREIAKRRFKIDLFKSRERLIDELKQKIEDMQITITSLSAELSAKNSTDNEELKKLEQKLEEALDKEKNLLKRIEQLEIKLDEERRINERLQEELMEKDKLINKQQQEEKIQLTTTMPAQITEGNIENRELAEEVKEDINEEDVPFFSPMDENLNLTDLTELPKNINAPALILKKGVIQASTPTFADMIGYTRGELKNKSFFTFVSPDRLIEIKGYYLDRLKGKDVNEYETTLLTKEKEAIPVKIKSNPINWKGERAELIIVEKID